jgi:quercetin dioxygenase-like cupin family protein
MMTAGKLTPRGSRASLIRSLALALLALGFLRVGPAEAQRVVMVYEEPRHRLVFEDGDLKLLDVQILPGDTTLNHTHDSPILYTFISNGLGPLDGRVQTITSYATEKYTHSVTNAGPNLFRILALAHYGPPVEGGGNRPPEGVNGELRIENEWFRSYRLELAPGESTPVHRHSNLAVVIQVTEGHTEVSKAVGHGADLTRMGDWTVREAGSPYTIRNAGPTPVSIVVNEAKR